MVRSERIGESFAGRVTGLNIARGVSDAQLKEVEAIIGQYPVLCFPSQVITDEQQIAFVHRLGAAVEPGGYAEVARKKDNNPKLVDVTSVDPDTGEKLQKGSTRAKFLDANLLWHTDGSYLPHPIRITGLSARTLPTNPPDTEYADMRAAWDALSPAMKARCEDLIVEHSMYYSRRRMGMDQDEFSAEFRADFGFTHQPLVRTHPTSGRKSLYLASHAGSIVGWANDDGAQFLEELMDFATQPQFIYAHKWRPHDFVMWDDRCTMHRATPYAGDEPRMLRWSCVAEYASLITAAL